MVPVTQPQHHLQFGDGVARTVGPQMAQALNPSGTTPAPGSRWCSRRMRRWRSRARSRRCRRRRAAHGGRHGSRWARSRVDVLTALRGYTIGGAYRAHQEHRVGSLEPDKLADFAILGGGPDGGSGQQSSARSPSKKRGSGASQSTRRDAGRPVTSIKDGVVDIVIVGAGQAGLSLSHELAAAGREHVVLERGRIGETWRGRWTVSASSFRLDGAAARWTLPRRRPRRIHAEERDRQSPHDIRGEFFGRRCAKV